jgi:multiple sugar transport system permease protein
MNKSHARTWLYVILIVGSVLMSLPFGVMLILSFSQTDVMLAFGPTHWTLTHYIQVFQKIPFFSYLLNSLWVGGLTTAGVLLISSLAGFALSRFQFRGKNLIFFLILITMMVPPPVNLVPLFKEMAWLGWVDQFASLIIPGLFSAFGTFLMRQAFLQFPKELEDAARIEGCSAWQIFTQLAVPTVLPSLATLAVFTFIGSWNNLIWPLVVTQSEAVRTLPVGLTLLKSQYRDVTDWGVLMAASTLSVLPVVLVYCAAQRYFVEGMLQGGVKE